MPRSSEHANRLVHETSPYLRQHAQNPVDWYPWGPEALARARELDRPIFLSVGYSACHWCHVMEHESFEKTDIAAVLNEHFVSIKVDREERPDLDQIYMTAVQLLTGQGGWPMSVFLTPELQPFFGGTYFPPDDRYGRPGFKRLLLALADAWRNRRPELLESAGQITQHLQAASAVKPSAGELRPELIRQAVANLRRVFDPRQGGFGSAPKFPHAMEMRLLLRAWKRFDDDDALHMARLTLDRMALGGMYDHLGGGFHRYSTDAEWLVPHFEKMLYDNALLTAAYLEAYQATGEMFYREVVEETLAYVLREMTSPDGPFCSTQDADSEGVEGKFYVWSAAEVETILGKETAQLFNDVYGVSAEGNWEGHNILNRPRSFAQEAKLLRVPEDELRGKLAAARQKLLEVRSRRVWPARDEKILTAWNGLMIAAFAQAAAALNNPAYAEVAARAADNLLTHMRSADGRLLRTTSAGSVPKLNAYLEDYAFLIDALVRLYEATFAPRWIEAARELSDIMIAQFADKHGPGFFFTGEEHEALIARVKDMHDSSIPSGNSMAATALLRLGKLLGRRDYLDKASATLQGAVGLMESSSMAAGQLLIALDFYLGPVQEIAIVGTADTAETERVLRAVHTGFRPSQVVAYKASAGDTKVAEEAVPLLRDKSARGDVTTYICQDFACQTPLVGAAAVEKILLT